MSPRPSRPRSPQGGPHELGQNFLVHRPTVRRIVDLVATTHGPILELGAGDGALTRPLAELGRPVTALEVDGHRAARLRAELPGVRVEHADALHQRWQASTIVSNVPFHLTTPILRRLLRTPAWRHAVLLTQWEVARKRAGVGGATLLTAQSAPWFSFALDRRVPATCFRPIPSVDGGLLVIARRGPALLPPQQRRAYEAFVRAAFTGRGGTLVRILARAAGVDQGRARAALRHAGVAPTALPRDLDPDQWVALWTTLGDRNRA